MRKNTLPDWVLTEAAKRCDWHGGKTQAQLRGYLAVSGAFNALCDMILKHEQPPLDRKEACALEAVYTADTLAVEWTEITATAMCVRAIELWEDGFGT